MIFDGPIFEISEFSHSLYRVVVLTSCHCNECDGQHSIMVMLVQTASVQGGRIACTDPLSYFALNMFLKTFLLLLFTLVAPQVELAQSVTKTLPVPEISRHARYRSLDQLRGENFSVGMMTRTFTDEKRKNWDGTGPRPLRTAVWYPAQSGTGEMETVFGGPSAAQLFSPITVAGGAELSPASQKYPLVLLSHGTGGSAVMMMWLGHYLAGRGYIVAAVNHHGNTASERQPAAQGFLLFWERARDLTAVLDKLLKDPVFGARIDQNRIGAAGFSLGGYTVISIAGGVFSPGEFENFCRSPRRDFTCEPQPEFPDAAKVFAELKKTDAMVQESLRHASDSYRDERIKRVFAIAPALGSGFSKAGLRRIKVPVKIVVGENDEVTPAATNARRYASLIRGAMLTVLPGKIGHYTFLAQCQPLGKTTLPICRDAEGVDRGAVHAFVSQLAFEFFEK